MEQLLEYQFTYWHMAKLVLWFGVIYILLRIIRRFLAIDKLSKTQLTGAFRRSLSQIVERILILFEPAFIISILTIFVFINPLLHGLGILVVIIAGFPSINNYINGRFLLLNSAMSGATQIETSLGGGSIFRKGRTGVYIQTPDGLQHVPYSMLVKTGYTLISGDKIGQLVHLEIKAKDESSTPFKKLRGILLSNPYLDLRQAPHFESIDDDKYVLTAMMRETKYITNFMDVIREWGWHCKEIRRDN